jgi:hypothetical protein
LGRDVFCSAYFLHFRIAGRALAFSSSGSLSLFLCSISLLPISSIVLQQLFSHNKQWLRQAVFFCWQAYGHR